MQQRVLRNPLFSRPLNQGATGKAREYVQLTPLDSLIGAGGHKCLVGMLTQVEEGVFYLEDLNAKIPLDLSNAATTEGFFTEGCVVLAEGELEDGVFRVSMMGFPPPEARKKTLATLGGQMSGGNLDAIGVTSPQDRAQLEALEAASTDAMFVLLSDVHLDRPEVMAQLRKLFEPILGRGAARMDLSKLVASLVETGRRWGVATPEELVLFGKQLGYFERYSATLAPEWILGQDLFLFKNILPDEVAAAALARDITLPG